MLFAVSHPQNLKALPFEPPTQLRGIKENFKDQFKKEEGVKSAERLVTAVEKK